jgi:tetratricopeptide (TPR) repeat protein
MGDPHAALGVLARKGRLNESIRELEKALALDPRNGNTHFWYSLSLITMMGRADSALAELGRAHELDPVGGNIAANYAQLLATMGRPLEAESLYHRLIRENPELAISFAGLVSLLATTGHASAAIDTAHHHPARGVAPTATMNGNLACAFAKAGMPDSARALVRRAATSADSALRAKALYAAGWWSVSRAIGHASLGEVDSVIALVPGVMSITARTSFLLFNPCAAELLRNPRVMEAVARAAGGQ